MLEFPSDILKPPVEDRGDPHEGITQGSESFLLNFGYLIKAADDIAVFNGVCGAESGWVPVSAASPSLLLSAIEIEKRWKSQDRPPLLPPPSSGLEESGS